MTRHAAQNRYELLEALAERARRLTPIGARFLLNLKGYVVESTGHSVKDRAADWVKGGVTSARLGLWDEASNQWQRAVRLDPWNTDALNNLAVAHDLKGDTARAALAYEQALALEQMNVYIRHNYELLLRVSAREPLDEGRATTLGTKLCH